MTGGRERIWPRVVGVFLLAVPFLPLRRLFGPLDGADALVPPGEWTLGLGIFGTGSWLIAMVAGERAPSLRRITKQWLGGSGRATTMGAVILLAGLLLATSWEAFQRSPHLVDSIVQLFQAKIFAAGRLFADPPPAGGFFATQHMVADASGWYSQYPPGHPAFLAAGVLAGVPWAVPVVITLGTAVFLYLATRTLFGRLPARLTLVLLALCPFFWFMGASFMSHVSSLFFVSLFLYLYARWDAERGLAWAAAAGGALGAGALVRPLTAAAVAVVFLTFAARTVWRASSSGTREPNHSGGMSPARRVVGSLASVSAAAAGFAVIAGIFLVYNARVTGDPFLPGYLELWGSSHGLGFHETPWGGTHTPLTGLRNELIDLSLLNLFLFEWPVPALIPVGILFVAGWSTEAWDRRLAVAFLAIPAAYFFYWHRDAFLGPRFLYSGLAFLLPLTARSLVEAGKRLQGRDVQVGGLFRPVDLSRWAGVGLLLVVGYGVLYGAPQRFRVYASSMSEMKTDLRAQARQAGIDRGLVFVKVSWGNRLLAQLWGRGVPASTAERAYRTVDHCDLHEMLRRARTDGWTAERLTRSVEQRIESAGPLVRRGELNGDPTLRLRPGRSLSPTCEDAVMYDRTGYANYTPHLLANEPDLSGPFVVARDLRGLNGELRSRYPDLPAYLYRSGEFTRLDLDATRASRATGTGTGRER